MNSGIKTKGSDTLFGMKKFSIQHPRTRGYIDEWIFHQALKMEGLIYLRFKFLEVILNGKNLGIYALEENFDKRLIEHNNLKEGPILKISEDLIWDNYTHFGQFSESYYSYLINQVESFQSSNVNKNSTLKSQSLKAISILEAYRRGEISISEAFDLEKFSKFLAISTLFGANHGLSQRNTRFYYNPFTTRLEPIGYDATPIGPLSFEFIISEPYIKSITQDYTLFKAYITQLEKMSHSNYLDSFRSEIKDELEHNLQIIYSEFPWESGFPEILYENQKTLQKVLNPVKTIHAYRGIVANNYIEIELGNIQPIPIEIIDIRSDGGEVFKPKPNTIIRGHIDTGDSLFQYDPRIIIGGQVEIEPVNFQKIRFYSSNDIILSDSLISKLNLTYRILGIETLREENILPGPYTNDLYIENDFIREQPNLHDFDFAIVDESAKIVILKSGEWVLDKNLIIPGGYNVVGYSGLEIDLINSAKILSFSPLNLIGEKIDPIKIFSSDSSGQGLVVINSDGESLFEYVHFSNLLNPGQAGWELSGAITFYESPVRLSYCLFENIRAEDAINVVRTEFHIDNTIFTGAFSDAFDADFSHGDISKSEFIDSGNDAMDFSGSVTKIQNVVIFKAGDKGISGGEGSLLEIDGVTITGASVALASKDLSEITINNTRIRKSNIGFAAFQKKSEFGSASITATNILIDSTENPFLIELGSSILVDGKKIEPNRSDLKKILYHNQ